MANVGDQYAGGEVQVFVSIDIVDPDVGCMIPHHRHLVCHAGRLIGVGEGKQFR